MSLFSFAGVGFCCCCWLNTFSFSVVLEVAVAAICIFKSGRSSSLVDDVDLGFCEERSLWELLSESLKTELSLFARSPRFTCSFWRDDMRPSARIAVPIFYINRRSRRHRYSEQKTPITKSARITQLSHKSRPLCQLQRRFCFSRTLIFHHFYNLNNRSSNNVLSTNAGAFLPAKIYDSVFSFIIIHNYIP